MKNSTDAKKKDCFIITPIAENISFTRKRVDQWLKLIYKPALEDIFELIRADQISAPGKITEQVLHHVVTADLAIIDYTGINPNVMYEAAIRHISGKPYIQIYPIKEILPFDIKNLRAIPYDPDNLEYPSKLVSEIKKSYASIQNPDYKVPEILPLKFDLEKIVSDPVKFVEILKQHFLISSEKNKTLIEKKQNITEIYESPWIDSLQTALGITTKTIKCPKCGILQNITESAFQNAVVSSIYRKHYKCEVCGTEFSD